MEKREAKAVAGNRFFKISYSQNQAWTKTSSCFKISRSIFRQSTIVLCFVSMSKLDESVLILWWCNNSDNMQPFAISNLFLSRRISLQQIQPLPTTKNGSRILNIDRKYRHPSSLDCCYWSWKRIPFLSTSSNLFVLFLYLLLHQFNRPFPSPKLFPFSAICSVVPPKDFTLLFPIRLSIWTFFVSFRVFY